MPYTTLLRKTNTGLSEKELVKNLRKYRELAMKKICQTTI
jgi:hypothetical protein